MSVRSVRGWFRPRAATASRRSRSMGTPVSLCFIRQTARTPDRAMPADTVRAQHAAAVTA
ncbi:hypothetical protein [Streptomyces sp. NPDC047974]|uniref:hypothetical protein n=1 Tax=Streptomyces sp. NPDC047974 TaxID=3154343 RepID=UPI0033FCF232